MVSENTQRLQAVINSTKNAPDTGRPITFMCGCRIQLIDGVLESLRDCGDKAHTTTYEWIYAEKQKNISERVKEAKERKIAFHKRAKEKREEKARRILRF